MSERKRKARTALESQPAKKLQKQGGASVEHIKGADILRPVIGKSQTSKYRPS